ncbi:MAG: cadherin domain-containing protein, partial [Planctomycetota bacterium]
ENAPAGTVVATAAASDVDAGDSLTYGLAEDANGLFVIDPATGEITTTGALDFEAGASHMVRVVATDAGGLSTEAELAITVGDANDAPDALLFTGGSVAENAPVGTVVATASASDADSNDTLTFSLADDANGLFAIDPATGEITTTGALDFESAASHTVRVVATDTGGLSTEADLAIALGDVNEAPVFADVSGAPLNVQQGQPVSVDAGGVDPESDGLTYTWRQVAGPAVEIADADAATLEFVAPNLESRAEMVFIVEVSDGENTSERVVRVAVAAGDAGFDLESGISAGSQPNEAAVQQAAGADDRPAESNAGESSGAEPAFGNPAEADDGEIPAPPPFGDGAPSDYDADVSEAEPLEWLASEIQEIAEIARSVEAQDLGFDPGSADGEPEVTFQEVFSDVGFAGQDGSDEADTSSEASSAQNEGFLLKMLTLLRAGFGAQGRDDDSDEGGNNRFKR